MDGQVTSPGIAENPPKRSARPESKDPPQKNEFINWHYKVIISSHTLEEMALVTNNKSPMEHKV